MTKKILFIVALVVLQSFQFIAAQDVKQPVQFVFLANKLSDTSATLSVKAVPLKMARAYLPLLKKIAKMFLCLRYNWIVLYIQLPLNIKEEGVAGAVALPGSTDKGTAYDSVTFVYTV